MGLHLWRIIHASNSFKLINNINGSDNPDFRNLLEIQFFEIDSNLNDKLTLQ